MLTTGADQGFIEDRANSWLLISWVAVCFLHAGTKGSEGMPPPIPRKKFTKIHTECLFCLYTLP